MITLLLGCVSQVILKPAYNAVFMTTCKDITTQIFDLDRFEFITDGKLAIQRLNSISKKLPRPGELCDIRV